MHFRKEFRIFGTLTHKYRVSYGPPSVKYRAASHHTDSFLPESRAPVDSSAMRNGAGSSLRVLPERGPSYRLPKREHDADLGNDRALSSRESIIQKAVARAVRKSGIVKSPRNPARHPLSAHASTTYTGSSFGCYTAAARTQDVMKKLSIYCSRVALLPANGTADCHPPVLGRFAPSNRRLQRSTALRRASSPPQSPLIRSAIRQ